MTSEEIQARIDRIQLEKRYKALLEEQVSPPQSKEKNFVTEALKTAGQSAIQNVATQTFNYVMGSLINKVAGKDSKQGNDRVVNPYKGQKDKN